MSETEHRFFLIRAASNPRRGKKAQSTPTKQVENLNQMTNAMNPIVLRLFRLSRTARAIVVLVTLVLVPLTILAQSNVPGVPLQLSVSTNGINLTVGSLSQPGAVFVQTAADLYSLSTNAISILQTNTPLSDALQLQVAAPDGIPSQAFFSALFFPGQSVADFGDPEDATFPTDPTNVLFSSGMPTNLVSGQTFPIAFIVTDPTGQPLALTGTATVMVVSASDGSSHPDATVTPPTGQMTNGFLQMQITVNAVSSLASYTLALSIVPTPQGAIRPKGLSPTFFQVAFDLGPASLTPKQIGYYSEQLKQLRATNTDNGNTWNNPLVGGYARVSGSFGEWRGDNNSRCHHGLDLPAPAASMVIASRSGVVSARGVVAGIGAYVVIDHGNGWFSRYLHLDQKHILVHLGQPVARNTPLANQLYSPPDWGVHLHFEILYDTQQMSHWENGLNGVASVPAQDPVLTQGIFPVPTAINFPQMDSFGLTAQSPKTTVFDKNATPPVGSSPVYLFVETSDDESGNNPGPRSVSFWPEGSAQPQTITPSNDTVLVNLYAPLTGKDANEGFARYKLVAKPTPTNRNNQVADSDDYFRYWFKWNTLPYAANRIGPRSFTNSVQGYSGRTNNYTFTFGPQIKGGVIAPVGPQQYQFRIVAYLGTNFMSDPSQPDLNFSQPDQYQLQIIQTNAQPLAGVNWWLQPQTGMAQPLTGNYTPMNTVHTNEHIYLVTLPSNAPANGLSLRVSSRLVPDIAHSVDIQPMLATIENDGSLTASYSVEYKGTLNDGSSIGGTTNVTIPGYGTIDIFPVTFFVNQVKPPISLNVYAEFDAFDAEGWGFGVDLHQGFDFISVYSDVGYQVVPLNGATSYYDYFYYYDTPDLQSSHTADFLSVGLNY